MRGAMQREEIRGQAIPAMGSNDTAGVAGFLWQSTRLLAHETGTLAGSRREAIDDATAVYHVMRVCKPSWWLAPQSRDDCSHAAGHGQFEHCPNG